MMPRSLFLVALFAIVALPVSSENGPLRRRNLYQVEEDMGQLFKDAEAKVNRELGVGYYPTYDYDEYDGSDKGSKTDKKGKKGDKKGSGKVDKKGKSGKKEKKEGKGEPYVHEYEKHEKKYHAPVMEYETDYDVYMPLSMSMY